MLGVLSRTAPTKLVHHVAAVRPMSAVSVLEQWPNLPETSPSSSPATEPEVTTLSNGVRVVSVDQHNAASTVGVFVRGGSRYESARGAAHYLTHMAFKTTHNRSSLKIQRDIESFGGSVGAWCDRDMLTYAGSSLRDHAPELIETLAESITQPSLRPWEVKEEKESYSVVLSETANPEFESLMSASFGRSTPMGRSLYPSAQALSALSADDLRAHLGAHLTAPNVVIAASNIEHSELVALSNMHFLEIPEGSAVTGPPAKFVGGEHFVETEDGTTAVTVGLAAPGLNSKSYMAALVLESLLTRRFGVRWLTPSGRLEVAARDLDNTVVGAGLSGFSDVSVLSLTSATADGNAGRALDMMAGVVKSLGSSISADELNHAKAAARVAVASTCESSSISANLGIDVLMTGAAPSMSEELAAVDAVTAADVQKVIAEGVKQGIALSSQGEGSTLPRYDAALALFQ